MGEGTVSLQPHSQRHQPLSIVLTFNVTLLPDYSVDAQVNTTLVVVTVIMNRINSKRKLLRPLITSGDCLEVSQTE